MNVKHLVATGALVFVPPQPAATIVAASTAAAGRSRS